MKSPISKIPGIIVYVSLLLTLGGCQKDEEIYVPVKKYHSTFRGSVFLYLGNSPHKDIKVTIQKGNFTKETHASEEGVFFFDSLETGTYNLTFEKENYGTHKIFGVRHFGYPSDTLNKLYVQLYPKVASIVQKVGLASKEDYTHSSFLRIELNISDMAFGESVIIFVSKNKNVSKDSYEFYFTKDYINFWMSGTIDNPSHGIYFPYSEILRKGYKNGDKVFFKFYTINRNDVGYTDYEQKKQVFPSISSNQLSAQEHILSF